MTTCDSCGKKIDGLPFHCRRCNGHFCSEHRLPESHNCSELKRGNIFKNLVNSETTEHEINRTEDPLYFLTSCFNPIFNYYIGHYGNKGKVLGRIKGGRKDIVYRSKSTRYYTAIELEDLRSSISKYDIVSKENLKELIKKLSQIYINSKYDLKLYHLIDKLIEKIDFSYHINFLNYFKKSISTPDLVFSRNKSNKRNYPEVAEHHKREYVGTSREKTTFDSIDKTKSFLKRKYYKTKSWLNSRHHRIYRNWNALFMNMLWIIVLSISFMTIYSNLEKLNEVILWFLPLGGALLLVNAFFWLKYFWKLLKRLSYWYNGERNWVKYLIIIILIILLWQGYETRDTLFDSAIEKYDNNNFTSILPLGISKNIQDDSLFSKKSVATITEGISQNVNEIINPEPISSKTMDIEKAIQKYTNVERKTNGLSSLEWDSKLATVARDHSLDMVENDFFSHDNLRDEDPTDRAIRHSYNIHKDLGGGWYSEGIAENIGQMPTGNVEGMGYISSDADSIAEAHVESWMGSSGHRANILESQYTILGVGCAYDGLYYTCTQNFY